MVWIVLVLIAIAFAYLFNLGILVYALYAILAVLFISHLFASGWIGSLQGKRRLQQTVVTIGTNIPVAVEIKNVGRVTVSWVLIEDMLSRRATGPKGTRLKVTGRHIEVVEMGSGKTFQMVYQLKCQARGYYQIGPLIAETGDFFGLNRRFKVLSEPDFILVRPKIMPLQGYDIASRRPIGEIVMTHRLFEDPTRIAGVRQYQSGDALGRIHWRATARTGQLQSKTYEPSTVAGATILVDFHQDSFEPGSEPVRSELSVTCAASIANAIHEMGQQVGIVSNGRDAADRIRIEGWKGDRRTRKEAQASAAMADKSDRLRPVVVETMKADDQMIRILDTLGRLEKTDGLNFFELVQEAQDRIPKDATVIAILSKVDMETGVALGQLRQQGYGVTAIVNCQDTEAFSHWSIPLLAEGIETRHLSDEDAISGICEKQVLMG